VAKVCTISLQEIGKSCESQVTLLKVIEPAVKEMCLESATIDTVQEMQSEAIIAMVIQPLKVYFLHQIFSCR
jgi:hypothetical protein